ncbi:MFS transporter, partial [Mycolicibacterium poriferae]|uniref:MFS transporter n=1 Tax=Mycolicibacterium poriferae TaxID=39694 RepID=UPI00321BAC95
LVVTATTSTGVLLPRFGPRWLMSAGMLIAAGGMLLLTQITETSSYASHVLPALLIMGVGIGASMAPAMQGAISGVSPDDAGVASATVNTMQQVGGSVGTAFLSTIAASSAATFVSGHASPATDPAQLAQLAAVHSYTTAFWVAAAVFAVGGLIAALLVRSGKLPVAPDGTAAMAH